MKTEEWSQLRTNPHTLLVDQSIWDRKMSFSLIINEPFPKQSSIGVNRCRILVIDKLVIFESGEGGQEVWGQWQVSAVVEGHMLCYNTLCDLKVRGQKDPRPYWKKEVLRYYEVLRGPGLPILKERHQRNISSCLTVWNCASMCIVTIIKSLFLLIKHFPQFLWSKRYDNILT